MAHTALVFEISRIVEMPAFTRRVTTLLHDDDYRQFQLTILRRPTLGRVIQGTGGLRKVRWDASGRGKRGGVRIIYYWAKPQEEILMLFIYGKDEQDDLTPSQRRQLRTIVETEYP